MLFRSDDLAVAASYRNLGLNPIDLIGRAVTYLSDVFQDDKDTPDWNAARKQSYLIVPTAVSTGHYYDTEAAAVVVEQVSCGAGVTALIMSDGSLRMFGLNAMGQCGIGHSSGNHNVWTPTQVTGLSSDFAPGQRADLPQSYPVQHVSLGLQRTCFNGVVVVSWERVCVCVRICRTPPFGSER